jgi:hypothetical protein
MIALAVADESRCLLLGLSCSLSLERWSMLDFWLCCSPRLRKPQTDSLLVLGFVDVRHGLVPSVLPWCVSSPALGLCRLCKVSQSRTHDALLSDIGSAHTLLCRACK